MNKTFVYGGIMIAIVIAIAGLFFPQVQSFVGRVGTQFPHGIVVGSNTFSPSNLSLVKAGTCSILANASVAATSTANFDCAFTGVRSGDVVVVTQVSSSTVASQYVIKGANASSTADFITFSVLNLTGAAATPAATNGFGSSTQVLIFRTQTQT